MTQGSWAGPIALASLVVTLYTVGALVIFVWTDGWQERILLSGFALFGMVALAYELGYKHYWRVGRRIVFTLIFALPITLAAAEYVRRSVS
jgi:hypothetical protein